MMQLSGGAFSEVEMKMHWERMVLPSSNPKSKMDAGLLGSAVARALKEKLIGVDDQDALVRNLFQTAFHEVGSAHLLL
jgi:hypothetical protein